MGPMTSSKRPPKVVTSAVRRGMTTHAILGRYDVPPWAVRLARWQLGIPCPHARRLLARHCDVDTAQALVDAGHTLRDVARLVDANPNTLRTLAARGALLYAPASPASPAAASARAARRARRAQHRHERVRLIAEMTRAGFTSVEIAEVVGITPRAVRYRRAQLRRAS